MKRTPLVPSDLLRLVTVSDPQCAPGGTVFYVHSWTDADANETRSAIWRAGRNIVPSAFTSGPKDRMPRLSRDGKTLAFVGERGERQRVYVMSLMSGGEARAITPAYDAIGALAWSWDGTMVAFTGKTALDVATASIALDEQSGARHIRGLPFKSDDDGLLDGRRLHLFIVDLAGGEPRQITAGDFNVEAPSWAPDGRRLAFAAKLHERAASFVGDICTVERDGGAITKLTRSQGPATTPAFSHDGAEIAFTGHENGDDPGGRVDHELLVVDSRGGPLRSLSRQVGRTVGDWIICDVRGLAIGALPVWSHDDAEILVLVSDAGTCGIRAFARRGKDARVVTGGRRDISAFSRAADGTIAFAYSDPLVPSEVCVLSADGHETRLTQNNAWLNERTIRAPREVRREHDGVTLEGWVLDADGGAGGPLLVQVHGGPHTAYGYAFFFEFQMIAGHGISVAYGNPRGSQSYGTAFSDAITGRWGHTDADDVLAILDAVLEDGTFDATRVGIAGGSYGGFMTTWLLGHSKRFACGISMRAVNDFVSEVGGADLGWFLERELEAPWGDGGRRLFEMSPMRTAHDIEAPLLVEHSERDYRCPIDQGEQLFTLLHRLGKIAEFVRFTGDGHNLARTGKPRNRILRLRAILQWLGRHLKPEGWTAAPSAAGALFAPLESER